MEEMKNNAPKLSEIKKENPFGTPNHYFDDFSARLQARMEAEKQPEVSRKVRFIRMLKPALGLAASFALIFMLVYVPLKKFAPEQKVQLAEAADSTEVGIRNLLDQIDEMSFIALLNDSEAGDDNAFSDDELTQYVAANFSDYEIFENIANNN